MRNSLLICSPFGVFQTTAGFGFPKTGSVILTVVPDLHCMFSIVPMSAVGETES